MLTYQRSDQLEIVKYTDSDFVECQDSVKYILYSTNNMSLMKSKYMNIKFLFIKEKVQSGHMSIEHIGRNSMIADPLTKGLSPKMFHEHTARMGVISFQDIQF